MRSVSGAAGGALHKRRAALPKYRPAAPTARTAARISRIRPGDLATGIEVRRQRSAGVALRALQGAVRRGLAGRPTALVRDAADALVVAEADGIGGANRSHDEGHGEDEEQPGDQLAHLRIPPWQGVHGISASKRAGCQRFFARRARAGAVPRAHTRPRTPRARAA